MAAAAVQTPSSIPERTPPKRDIPTTVNYFKPNADGSPPEPTYTDRPETYSRPYDSQHITVKDMAGDEANFTLDRNGFQVYDNVATEKDFLDDNKIKTEYYAETAALLKEVTGASRVFIFDHTLRRQVPQPNPESQLRGPIQHVHVDQSYSASLSRVRQHIPDDAEHLLKGRVQIINVWRPIRKIERDPLAVMEANSIPDSDLVVTELIYPDRKGETYAVKYNESHKWYYRSGLEPSQVLLIKCFDSKTDGRARRVPHTAFIDKDVKEGTPARESIETRALVFHEDDRD